VRRCLAALLGVLAAVSARAADPVTATMRLDGDTAVVEMTIASGWHVNAHEPDDRFLVPTTLELAPPSGMHAGTVRYPAPVSKVLAFSEGKAMKLYEGRVRLEATLEGTAVDATPVRGKLRYQACDDTTCLPPRTIELAAERAHAAAGAASPTAAEANDVGALIARIGWLGTLGWVLLLGAGLNLTPCVYPLISVTVAFFGGRTGQGRGQVWHALAYVLGICITFSALGVTAALTGSLFGAALQRPAVLGAMATLMALLAASSFGLYQLRVPTGVMQWAGRSGEGATGALFMGLTMGVVASPCIGPIVAALLVYVGARQSVAEGLVLFFALGLGLGLPYVGLALTAERLRRLPRSGEWLAWMERLFGFMLLGLALHFATPLMPARVVHVAWTLLVVTAGIVLGFVGHVRRRPARRLRRGVGLGVAAAGVALFFVAEHGPAIAWRDFSEQALADARAARRPVLIDFQALWCLPCREMERTTFRDPDVVRAARGFATLKADVTSEDDANAALMSRFGVPGVPTYVILDAEGNERRRFVGYVAAPAFQAALHEVAEAERG
jgi:thioredoxin:protein disulfide reductase